VGWRGLLTDWRRWPGGVLAPARLRAKWEDEAAPWIDMRVRTLLTNVPVDDALRLGELALRSLPALSAR
jgi:hypothetical protein